MIHSWILEYNLESFLTVLGWLISYDFDPDDWIACSYGVAGTDSDKEQWFDYKITGTGCVEFLLARDPGTTIIEVKIDCPAALHQQVGLAISICQFFRLSRGE